MQKTIIAVITLAVVGATAWYFLAKDSLPAGDEAGMAATSEAYEWTLTALAEDETGMPKTSVALTAGAETFTVGSYNGSCAVIADTSWELLEGEVTGVICWWAGGGDEIGVFSEGGRHVIKTGFLDEGSAEIAGFRGDFTTVREL
jgi:hypothetical protein